MVLFLIIVLASLFFGWTSSLFFKFIDNMLKRIAFSIFIGFISTTWLSLVFSWFFFKQLGLASTLMTIIVLLIAGMFLWFKARERKSVRLEPLSRSVIVIISLIVCVYAVLNLTTVLFTNEQGGWSGMISAWADYPFHLGLINSFVLRDNFPPQYPVLIGSPLTYSFAIDFFTAVLVKNGLGLREGIWFVNISLFFCLTVFMFSLAEEFSSSKKVAAITLILFLFNGNAGIFNALNEAVVNPVVLMQPGHDFSHNETSGLFYMNVLYAVLVPQRTILLGFTAALLVYFLLFKNFSEPPERQSRREFLLAGLMFGLLPLMHGHSFIAAGVVAAILFLYRPSRSWLYFIIPAILLALPQFVWINQHSVDQMFSMHLGWITSNEGKPFIDIVLFWLANGWIVFVLSFAGLAFATRKQMMFYAPFLALFLIGNIIRFQPWDFDNYKIFMHWHLLASIIAAIAIVKLFEAGKNSKNRFRSLRVFGFRTLAIAFIVFGIASGILTVLWMEIGENARYQDFSPAELEIAQWIKTSTPNNAIFLTSDAHTSIVQSIAGRQIVMGFVGWLWSHGLNYREIESDVKVIYATGNCDLIKKYGINYIFVGPQESKLNPNTALFESSFEKVFSKSDSALTYNIFKTKC